MSLAFTASEFTHALPLAVLPTISSFLARVLARYWLRPGRHQAWLSMMNAIISLAGFFLHMTGVPAEVALVVIDALPTRSTELRVPSCLSRCPAGLCSIILCSCSYISTMTRSLLLLLLHRSFSDSSSNMIVQA